MTRNARTKKRTRARADREGQAYCTAGHSGAARLASRPLVSALDLARPVRPEQLLRDSFEGWCESVQYAPIEDLSPHLVDELDLLPELEDVTVHELAADLDTMTAQVVDEYEGDTVALSGTARATLYLEGVMVRAEAWAADAEGTVGVGGERNEYYMEVVLRSGVELELELTAIADLSSERIEDLDVSPRAVDVA